VLSVRVREASRATSDVRQGLRLVPGGARTAGR
jgi:hypothetical protein